MYETFFGLKRRPFLAVPDTDSYFSVDAMEEARQAIQRTVRRGEGISLIFGPSGTGKTLLLRLLRQSLEIDHVVSLVSNGHLDTPKAFFQQLLFDLRLPYMEGDEAELRLQLLDFARQEVSVGLALLVDESQFIDATVLEEIRLLMNCDDGAAPFFRAVLAGTPEFEEKLTHPHLEAFNQRVVSRSYLEPFSREDTYRYIEWQSNLSRGRIAPVPEKDDEMPDPALGLAEFIKNSGSPKGFRIDSPHVKNSEPIFTMAARRQIHQFTEGLPRLINQLCDVSLQLAAERLLRQVDETIVQSAWSRLQRFDETETANRTDKEENSVMSVEDIDEIIARKKATFQPKTFDSTVQFGTLDGSKLPNDDGPATEIEAETTVEEEVVEEPKGETPSVIDPDSWAYDDRLDPQTEEPSVEPPPVLLLLTVEKTAEEEETPEPEENDENFVPVRRPVIPPVRRKHETTGFSRNYLLRREVSPENPSLTFFLTERRFTASDDWIGNIGHRLLFLPFRWRGFPEAEIETIETVTIEAEESPVVLAAEDATTPVADVDTDVEETEATFPEASSEEAPCMEEPPMDAETLEKYGAEILSGRPPFVRKEPNYAYQTTEETPLAADSTTKELPEYHYPDPSTGNVIALRWIQPEPEDGNGFGTVYREFLERIEKESRESRSEKAVASEPAAEMANAESIAELASVVRVVLSSEDLSLRPSDARPALDESFEEIVTVLKQVIALDELYHSELVACRSGSTAESPRSLWTESTFQRQIETVIRRFTEAAEKIEQAADAGQRAGEKIEQAADTSHRAGGKIEQAADTSHRAGEKIEQAADISHWAGEKIEQAADTSHRAGGKIEQAADVSHRAGEKIEQAAEVSSEAGRQIRNVANFVEAEVKSSLPTYLELFQELSEFQQTITEELTFVRELRRIANPNCPANADPAPGDLSIVETPSNSAAADTPRCAGRLLPFPRRPDFGTFETGTGHESVPRQDDGNTSSKSVDEPKDDQSIDVRTLFQ